MRVWGVYHPSMILLGSLGIVLTVWVGARMVLAGGMPQGHFFAFLMLTGFLYEPINRLHQLNQLVQAGRAAGERRLGNIRQPIEPGRKKEKAAVRGTGDVRFDHVGVRYGKEGNAGLPHLTPHPP